MIYAEGKYIAVGYGNESISQPPIHYSADGSTWTAATIPTYGNSARFFSLANGDGRFATSCTNIPDYTELVSKDGVTWEPAGGYDLTIDSKAMVHASGRFVNFDGNVRKLET